MKLIKIVIGLLLSTIAIAAVVRALFSTEFPQQHPIIATGLCIYGCVITPLFILLGESIIEDLVKLVIMFGIAAAIWYAWSWPVALPFIVPPVCGMLANQIIKTINQRS